MPRNIVVLLLTMFQLGVVGCVEVELPTEETKEEPLMVVATVPGDGESLPTTNAEIRVIFSKPVDPASLHEGIMIIGVPVRIEYDPAQRAAIVRPLEPLRPGTAYTLVVRQVYDTNGSKMESVVTVNFTAQ